MTLQIFLPQPTGLVLDERRQSPALERLLAMGKHVRHSETLEVIFCQEAGVSKQTDWPIAPLRWLGEGGKPETAYWLCADPVHLVLQRDSFSLYGSVHLSQPEAQTLIALLNKHFAPDSLQFYMGGSGRWYLRLEENPEINTTLFEAAMGQDINAYLPQGAGAARWNRLLNEMQMLLHEHPVNQAREARGELPVNSVWLSGGGVLPAKIESSPVTIFANHALAKGLGLTANWPCSALPENLETVINHNTAWLALDDVNEAESKWFASALAGLQKGKISQLNLHFAMRDQTLTVDIRPRDLWKFWRKTKPLRVYLA